MFVSPMRASLRAKAETVKRLWMAKRVAKGVRERCGSGKESRSANAWSINVQGLDALPRKSNGGRNRSTGRRCVTKGEKREVFGILARKTKKASRFERARPRRERLVLKIFA